jgi:hypothetical protein
MFKWWLLDKDGAPVWMLSIFKFLSSQQTQQQQKLEAMRKMYKRWRREKKLFQHVDSIFQHYLEFCILPISSLSFFSNQIYSWFQIMDWKIMSKFQQLNLLFFSSRENPFWLWQFLRDSSFFLIHRHLSHVHSLFPSLPYINIDEKHISLIIFQFSNRSWIIRQGQAEHIKIEMENDAVSCCFANLCTDSLVVDEKHTTLE